MAVDAASKGYKGSMAAFMYEDAGWLSRGGIEAQAVLAGRL
jgi:hypothetical protein